MQEIHQLDQRLLGFILPCHVGKLFAGSRYFVQFRAGLAKPHGADAAAHTAPEQLDHPEDEQSVEGQGQHVHQQDIKEGKPHLLPGEGHAVLQQPLYQVLVVYGHRLISRRLGKQGAALGGEGDDGGADLHRFHLPLLHHLGKGGVVHRLHRAAQPGHGKGIHRYHDHQGQDDVEPRAAG